MNWYSLALRIMVVLLLIPCQVGFSQENNTRKKSKPSHSIKNEEEDEEDENKFTRWEFGVNFGTYFADKYTANYYNGSEQNVNKLSYVWSNYYWYREIALALQSSDTVIIRGLPTDMHYTVALTGGLFLRYNFVRNWGLFFEFNYAKLKTDDGLTVEVDPPTYLREPDLRILGIHGSESRMNIDLGIHRKFGISTSIMNMFIQAAFNLNYTRVLTSSINVIDREYSLINIYGDQYYIPNTSLQEYNVIQGGVGYGLKVGGGLGFNFTRQIGLELGFSMYYVTLNLEGYRKFNPSFDVYVRLLLSNLISRQD